MSSGTVWVNFKPKLQRFDRPILVAVRYGSRSTSPAKALGRVPGQNIGTMTVTAGSDFSPPESLVLYRYATGQVGVRGAGVRIGGRDADRPRP